MDETRRRIQSVRGGGPQPIVPQRPLLSSAQGVGWQGLLLERHLADAVYDARHIEAASNILHFFEGLPLTSEWRFDGRTVRVLNLPASVALEPKGFHFDVHCVRAGPAPQWILALDQAMLGQRLAETVRGGGPVELTPHLNLTDPQIVALCRLLHADLEAGCPAGPLYGELVGAALAIQLVQQCSTAAIIPDSSRGGLPPARLRRVLEYIDATLHTQLRVNRLAREAGVSAFHFARLFKQSTGSSPHQYLLQRRLDRGKTLLRQGLSLTEISASTGFADQSHFAKVFRRFTGVTPSEYRNQR